MFWAMVRTANRRVRIGAVAAMSLLLIGLAACGSSKEAGNSGGGGDEATGLQTCQRTCDKAADCGETGDNWACKEGRCVVENQFDEACTTDPQCWARYSGWQKISCESSGCGRGDVCVELQGSDFCAPQKATDGCPVGSPYQASRADGSGMVVVCASQQYECDDGVCRNPCQSDDDCSDARICDEESGRCVCTRDDDCAGGLVCNKGTGECVCHSDSHCTADGADTCYDGACGCGGNKSCSSFGKSFTCAEPKDK